MSECYSRDEESFQEEDELEIVWSIISDYENLLEAIGHTYYKGESYAPKPSALFNLDRAIENMEEDAWDEYGEWSEDFLAGQNFKELETLINNWLDENVKISFFAVKDTVQKSVTKEMVEEYMEENKEWHLTQN